MSYARTCESCGKQLVEVDNPIRREVRHRRGEEVQCPAWREAVGLPSLSASEVQPPKAEPASDTLGALSRSTDTTAATERDETEEDERL